MNHHRHKDARDKCHEHIPEEAFHRVTSFREAAPRRRYVSALKASRCADFPYFFAPDGGGAEGAGGILLPFPRSGARALSKAMHKCALLDFGGLGAAPPVIRADGAVASPRRNTPLKKRPGKARTFPFDGCARSAFFGDTESVIDRGGVFRLWRSVLGVTPI